MDSTAPLRRALARHATVLRLAASALTLPLFVSLMWLVVAQPSHAFEAIEGRLQAHGYYEMQMRVMSRNYTDQWDMTMWYNIFNLELELDLVQETHGPLDLLSMYVRVEGRFDCIYSRGCGMIQGVDAFGNRSRRLPNRLQAGNEYDHAGSIFIKQVGPLPITPERNPFLVQQIPGFRGIYDNQIEDLPVPVDRTILMQCQNGATGTGGNAACSDSANVFKPGRLQPRFWQADRQKRIAGPDGQPINDGTSGAPYLIALQDFQDFKFTSIPVIGGSNSGFPNQLMGPWLPENFVTTSAGLANLPNPLDFSRVSPQSLSNGVGAGPMRPIPIYREDDPGRDEIWILQTSELNGAPLTNPGRWEQINPTTGQFSDVREWNNGAAAPWEARGAFTPSPQLKQALIDDKFTDYPFNISQTDRAFNRGASQNDEGELKEAYFDIEMFDSRLWLRLGKQSIVWGKTELFRTTDQFNPQDFALATLPSLEESRIALWAFRGVWSFYEVGPLSDVRLELAMNFDQFEPADLGACGEPYAINLICTLTFGSWAHGITGIGVAGFTAPPDPWDDPQGIEFGGRLEWRWDRYSFALTDFYGYSDFPNPVRLGTFSRNVDWRSGRPRYYMHTVEQMANSQFGCAGPQGAGVQFAVNPVTFGPDFTVAPTGAGTRVSFDQANETGCLTPGASNRQVRVLQTIPGSSQYYGVPYRVPTSMANTGNSNDLQAYQGQFLNNTSRSDPNDPRQVYSQPTTATPTAASDWPDGPQASYCETEPLLAGYAGCTVSPTTGGRGRRTYDTQKYITVSGQTVPNPTYNPFYDSRMDPYFDASAATNNLYAANPGNIVAATPVRFDPFKLYVPANQTHNRWANAYDPTLAYDSRNALDMSPVNLSIFNFICATTVGFSSLDPSACALTVFSSPKQPGGSNASTPRIASVISAFLSGSPLFNGFVGKVPTDDLLSKGPILPDGMGMPLVLLHADVGIPPDPPLATDLTPPTIGTGLNVFRTTDQRRHWADVASGTLPSQSSKSYPWIYSREAESYNCLPDFFVLVENAAPQLCGGLAINEGRTSLDFKYRNVNFLSRTLSPEQEALIGCGPLFGTSCDANGADFLWAEGSAFLQSFVGSDSLGVAFSDIGIQHLVSENFGNYFMDNNSPSQEYRTDGRVLDYNGNLIRIDQATLTPALGTDGYLRGLGNMGRAPGAPPAAPCNINSLRIVRPDGTIDETNRASARCWDLRPYLTVYGVQPGTAAFEIMGLGGPKCTTADIGGPLDPKAGVLPGCRNKWDTIQYRPLASWDGTTALQPNNPDAGYVGNNWYQQIFSYKQAAALGRPTAFNPDVLPNPRSDYRQWSSDPSNHQPGVTDLANSVPCGTGTPAAPGSPTNPQNYDCYLNNPSAGSPTADGRAAVHLPSNWTPTLAGWQPGSPAYQAAQATLRSGLNWGVYDPGLSGCDATRSASVMQNDPSCYVGGWNQTVDGDPDRLGVGADTGGGILYPKYVKATNGGFFDTVLDYGDRVENGCTPGSTWIFLQRTANNQLLSPPECAQVFVSPNQQGVAPNATRWPNELLGGTGHPFTGESFASEVAGISLNLERLLVTFSAEFTDGLASVRGFVNPELYESRFIYDEEWMWNPDCDQNPVIPNPNQKTLAQCGGRGFVRDPTFPATVDPYHSAYGDPNRDPFDPSLKGFNDPGYSYRIRQAFSQNISGQVLLNTRVGWQSTGLANVQNAAPSARSNKVPNPLPAGTTNKLQRDPSLPNILTTFPDLLMRECNSARRDYREGMTPAQVRTLYENCGTIKPSEPAFSGVNDWTQRANGTFYQDLRLGNSGGQGGLIESMLWDYAFTGTENDLMAIIPYCENLEYTQRHVESIGDTGAQPSGQAIFGATRIDCTRGQNGEVLGRERCTYVTPQYCELVQAVYSLAGQKRPILQAGGNGRFGRRTMQWQSGNEIYLDYEKRNVLGFSMDFAEDYTKSNWSMEFTWIEGVPQIDNLNYDLVTNVNDFNLTVSVDRPTFINFLNANRTFFINSQWFFNYKQGWDDGFASIGPWNVLATFAVFTGYFQDRLNPTLVFVYDFRSVSGGALPQVNYRFSENFSITVGASLFWGQQTLTNMPLNPIAPAGPRAGQNAYMDGITPGLSLVRDRDEVFMTLRYTF